MNDYLTEELCKELGQLDPDWFQVLTTRASSKEGNLSDSDDQEELCPNQEANFKTPLRKTAAADVAQSQHSSIPRVFRRSYVPSPDNDYQQENEPLPWDTRSPCLFGFGKDAVPHSNYGYAHPRTPNWFDRLHTPQVSPANYAQHISESLGADIHPDISWTSSLNTPPALPSTLIISKTNESPSPTTFCMGKSAVLVRKLFPSLSNDSRQGLASPQSNDTLEVLQDSDCPEACPHPTLQKSPRRSPQHNDGTRRQPLPEAIRSPAPSVPDGTENSLPVFLTNSSSVLRQVKSERTRRTEEKEHGSSPLDVSIESELAFSEQRESDQARCRNPPAETEDSELTPWSPLPLSEIPATTVATQVEDKCTTRAKSPVRASLKCAGFTQKKTAFIYTIDKEKHSLKNNSVQGHKLPVMQMSKANDEAGVCNVGDGKDELQQREAVAKEKMPSLLRVNTKDLEMSQLCRAFAQDLSQMSYPGAPPQVGPPSPPPPPPPPPCGFSPFTCLTALRLARRKAKRQVGLHGEVPLDESVDELAPSDSGFLSADADVSHATAACAEKQELHHRRTFESTPTKQHEMCLEEVLHGTWIDTKDTRGTFKDSTHPLVSLQSNGCERKQEIVNVSLPSIHMSEFKTSMQISAADPQKDEQLFDVCDAQRRPTKSVPGKQTPTTSDSALSCPGSLSEKCMWKNSDENGAEREETLQGFDGSLQQAQNVPKSPANVNTGTCQADGVISCDRDPKEEIPAGSYSPPSCPPKASQNNLPFDSSDTNKLLQGFSSCVKPVQDATKSPGNANAVAHQADQAFECARDATEEIPAASAPATWAQNCDRSNCRLTASQKADVKALCALLEEAGSQFDFTQFRTVKLKQPGKEASALSSKADKDLEPHLLSGIDFDDSFCAEANEKTTLTSCGTTHLEESGVARQPQCAHPTEKEERAEESVVRVSQKCLKKTKHLFQDSEASTPAQKQSVENDGSTLRVRTSRNEQQFVDGYDTEEPLRGFFSSAIPDQSAPKSPGNMLARARQEDFRNQESGIKQVDHLPGGSQFAGGKQVSSAALKKTESLLDVCHEVEEHPACDRAFGKSELPLTTSAKPRSFSANDPFDKLGSTSKSLSVSGGKTNDGRGNAANVQTTDGQLDPVENEKPEHQNSENAANSWLELDFSTWSGGGVSAAGGENTSASAVALTKTKPLLHEDRGDDPSADVKNGTSSLLKGVDHQPGGFRTAKGKRVAVSSAALRKAQLLLDDCSEVKEDPVCYPTATKSELLSANEKPGSFSDNSLFADDSLFDNLDRSPESPSVSGVKDAKTANATIVDKIDCPNDQVENGQRDNNVANPSLEIGSSSLLSAGGFSTASGKKVCVSAAALKKAKDLLQEDAGDALSSKMQHGSFLGVERADLAAAGRNVAAASSAALPTIKLLLDENLAVEEHPGCSPPSGKSEFLPACEKPASFAAKGDLGSTLESPSLTPSDSKRGNRTSKETLGGCFPVAVVTPKKASLPHKVTLQADAHFKGMMDSHDRTSGKENPSIVCAKALNVQTDAQNIWLHRDGVRPGNPSSDVASSSLSGAGFSAASGSTLPVSAAKAKHFFQEDHEDDPKMKPGGSSGVDRLDCQAGGFQTAGGKRVTVSSAALQRAKFLLDDCDSVEDHPNDDPLERKSEFLSPSEKPASFSAKSLFGDLGSTSDMMAAGDGTSDVRVSKNIPKIRLGNKNGAPFGDDKNTRHYKNLANPAVSSSAICSSSPSGSGFSTAGGRSLSVSDEAMTRAKSLFNDFEGENQNLHRNASLPHAKRDSPQHVGLRTADGGRASIASAALKKSKSFFAESHESTSDAARASAASLWGFSTASGKKVLVSDRAAARAKSLLDESAVDKDAGFRLSVAEKKANNPPGEQCGVGPSQISHCGFSAASGKPASFSTEALQKAKALFDDIGLSDGVQAGARGKTFSVPSVSGLTPGPSACSREKKPAAANEMARAEADDLHGQEPSAALGGGTIPMPEEAAIVNLESLDLSDCTETQQLFLAQEALDCTKALLQDESLAGPSMTLENLRHKSASCPPAREQAHEKRLAEGTELAGQPPSKRRLVEEFDRSLDSPRGSTLCPQTSSPKGLLKDRPVFKYDVSLGPNITRPRRDGTSVAAAASSKSNQQPSPAGLTLPFFKKTEARPRRSDIATPPAFVPPFKRQRTVVERDSTKLLSKKSTQNNEDPPTTASDQSMTDPFYGRIPPTDTSWGQANVELARDMQDMRIRKKTRQTVRPLPGSLFRAKTSGATRIRLKDAAAQRPPAKYTQKQLYEYGVHRHVCNITSETAEAFRFRLELFFKKDAFTDESGIQLADGGWLIPSEDGTAGKEQFCRALCDTPGVDPKLLADEWVYNHYRWIVWKLASMERSFPQTMGGRCLTPERVLLQLKYRYDVEVDHSRRPALRKIMEKDDAAAKTLVLCICGVVSQDQVANSCAVVWLTDGWYSVKAQLDEPLSALLRKGRLAAGGKLIIHGAQLVGSQEACAPLEAPQSLMLKIFANSSRPARWDTKLGFYKDPRPFLLPLSSLFSNGGPVGCVDIVVLRSYPIQWMERKSDGGVVFRLARAEEEEEARHNGRKQKAMEVLYAKIQAEFEQEDIDSKRQLKRRTVSHRDIGSLQDGQELYEAVGDDLAGLEALLSEQQLETLRAYSRSLMDKKRAEMQDRYRRATEKTTDGGQTSCPQRDVTPVWRLCVADSLNPTGDVYQLNLWRPSSDVQALLKESRRYKVYNLAMSDRKKRGAVGALQLTATKRTQFQDLQASPEWLSACFRPRVSTDFVALQKLEFDPPCGEVDLTGCVVSVLDGKGPSPAFYLVDGNVNFVKVLCFSSLLQAGLADVVKPGALLALSNLQLRGRSTRPTPVVYAGDLTVFSTKPKEEHLQKALGRLRDLLQEQETFFVCAEDKLSQVLKRDVCSPALPPKSPPTQHVWTNTSSQQPVRSLGSFTPPSRNLQAAADTSSSEKDPRSLKRRRAVDYLSCVPSPPPLFLAPGLAASPFVKKTFNPPRRASTLKTVHTPNLAPVSASPPDEKEEEAWVNDHELAMIDTQALRSNDAL